MKVVSLLKKSKASSWVWKHHLSNSCKEYCLEILQQYCRPQVEIYFNVRIRTLYHDSVSRRERRRWRTGYYLLQSTGVSSIVISFVRKRLEVEGNFKLRTCIPFTIPDQLSVARCHISQFVCPL